MLSLLQQDDQELFSVDSMTVISPLPVDDSLAVCWNPLRTPTDQLEDFTLEIGKAFGYGKLQCVVHIWRCETTPCLMRCL